MRIFKRATAALATVAILLTTTVFCYANGYDTVSVSTQTDYRLNYSASANLSVKTGSYTKYGNTYGAKVYTVEASPKTTSIVASSGKSVYGAKTLSDIISQTDIGGKRVAAAINADFFDIKVTGLPLGVQITDGRLVATNQIDYDKSNGRASIGFKADGTTVFGTPEFDISVTIDDYTVKIDKVNRQNNYTNHVLLFTSDFGEKTLWGVNAKGSNYDVIIFDADKPLGVDGKFDLYFYDFLQNVSEPLDIEQDKIYICAPTGQFTGFELPRYQIIEGYKVYSDDSFVTVTEKTGKWKGVKNAVGGGNMLISGGVIRYPSTYDPSIKNTYTSRTAFGVKADGTYVFYTAERNTASGNTGVWMDAVAQAMYDMRCVNAINLDGGGSTTIVADTGGGVTLQNKCQDGAQRKISNALLLLTSETAPEIVEDFEQTKEFTESYEGTNLVTATVTKGDAYTGAHALRLEYVLRGYGNSVGVSFAPIDVSKYKMLSIAVNEMGSGVRIDAKLKNGKKQITRTVLKGNEKSYVRAQIDVSDATELVGFDVVYELAAINRNYVLIDRIVGLGGDMSADTAAPQLKVSSKNQKLTVEAAKPVFTSGVDIAEITVDDGELLRTNELDTSTFTDDKVHKARVDVTDLLGNRAVSYQLFKTANYSKPQPFADMNDKKWDALALRYCYENGIVNGIKENGTLNFKGDKNVTRAEFCVMAVGSKQLDVNKYVGVTLPFDDAGDIPKWALLYVKAAYAEGIMTGSKVGDKLYFYANADITREQTASVVDRLITKDTRLSGVVKYADEGNVAKWAKKYVQSASTQGLFMGNTEGKFLPNKNLTRSEAAVVMSKI